MTSLFIFSSIQMPTPEMISTGLVYRLMILIIALIAAFITRFFLLRGMRLRMMKESKKAEQASVDSGTDEMVSNPNKLQLIELTSDSEQSEAVALRNGYVKRAKRGLLKLFGLDLLMIVIYALLGYNLVPTGHLEGASEEYIIQENKIFSRYYLFLFLFLFWNIMRYVGHSNQFKAYKKGLFGVVSGLWRRIFWFFKTQWVVAWAVVVMLNTLLTGFATITNLMFAAVALHIVLLVLLKRSGRSGVNYKLLILRVFAIKQTSMFTFSRMVNFWKHFGTYFTVADPAFYRINWKKRFNQYFPIYVVLIFFLFTMITDQAKSMGELNSMFGGFIFIIIVGAIIHVTIRTQSMKRSFVYSEAGLRNRLKKLDRMPKKLDNTYKEMPVMCFDNTWQKAVDVLSGESKVIMMDLRGFSESNKGCEYEIDFLFDNVPADKIVFITYEDSETLIRNTISERWARVSKSSPNLKESQPTSTLFITREQDSKEIQGLIDCLLLVANRH